MSNLIQAQSGDASLLSKLTKEQPLEYVVSVNKSWLKPAQSTERWQNEKTVRTLRNKAFNVPCEGLLYNKPDCTAALQTTVT